MRVGPRGASAWRSDHDPRVDAQRARTAVTGVRLSRMRDSVDFQRVLANPPRVSNQHFALHGLEAVREPTLREDRRRNLSTGEAIPPDLSVDNELAAELNAGRTGCVCLGVVVPKRLARRSVTRSLLKRQIRSGIERHLKDIPQGMWIVRLRTTFDKSQHVSAASNSLRTRVRLQLENLLAGLETLNRSDRLRAPAP
jgi:ribonuclease P protein component